MDSSKAEISQRFNILKQTYLLKMHIA